MTNPITVNSTKTVTSIIRNGTAIEKMMLAWEWQPQGLFLGDVQAAWYDSINTANDDWRRNMFTYTEQFNNAAWVKSTSPAVTLTDQGGGVWRLQGVQGTWFLVQPIPLNNTHTLSIEVKSNGAGLDGFQLMLGGQFISAGNGGGDKVATNEWVRYSAYGPNTGSGNAGIVYNNAQTAVDILIRFPQLELGSTATAYQRITDVNTEVRALFPNNTMFQDSAGSAPNAAASSSQVVGMWLDKSKAGQQVLPTTGWTVNSGDGVVTITDNVITITGATTVTRVDIVSPGWVVGDYVKMTVNASIGSSTGALLYIGGVPYSASAGAATYASVVSVASGTLTRVQISTGSATFTVTARSKTPGNHAIQASTTTRPLFGRSPVSRRNLLIRTEDFGNAAWVAVGTNATTTKGSVLTDKPDGSSGSVSTLTFSAVPSTAGSYAFAYQILGAPYLNTAVSYSVWLRVASGTATVYLNVEDSAVGPTGGNFFASPALALTTTWQRFTVNGTRTSGTGNAVVSIGFDRRASADQTNAASLTVQVWGAQLEIGSVATPYQKVVTALDITEAGKPSYAFMRPDLSDDKLTTNMASTKNLLRATEEFDNTATWTKQNTTIATTSMPAPDGTLTSRLITETTANNIHWVEQTQTTAALSYSFSCYFKAGTRTWGYLRIRLSGLVDRAAFFNLSDGTRGTVQAGLTATITPFPNGWYRCEVSTSTPIVGSNPIVVGVTNADNTTVYTGDGTSGLYIWGAQLELGSAATTYEYGGFKGDIIVAGKNGTAYETNVTSPTGVMDLGPLEYTGGTPGILRAVGDVVGYTMARKKFSDVEKAQLIRYYKKRGAKGMLTLGPELLTNGDFNNGTIGWTASNSTLTVSNGILNITGTVATVTAYQTFSVVSGRTYLLSGSLRNISSTTGNAALSILSNIGFGTLYAEQLYGLTAFQTKSLYFTPNATTTLFANLRVYGGGTGAIEADSISIREIRPEEEW